VYALGAILFEILTREPLHPRGYDAVPSTRGGVEARISVRAPGRHLPPELERTVVEAVALDPAARPSPRELADAIERYIEGERDLELRRVRSATHALEASRAAHEAKGGGPDALTARRDAMKEINRALVLDPSNTSAMATMADLLQHAPEQPPPEVELEIDRKFRHNLRWLAKMGAVIYGSSLGYLAVFWWMGIRQPAVVAAFIVLIALAAAASRLAAREREPSPTLVGVVAVASMLAFSFAARFTSPLLVVPAAILTNVCGFSIYVRKRQRLFVLGVAVGAWLMPLVLELTGLIPPTFAFRDDQLVILPVATHLPRVATLVLIVTAMIGALYFSGVLMGYMADRLARAEQRLFMYAWQLRELVPAEVRAVTDPTGPRR
jgi:serine/threonine-protein kinase